MTYLLKRESQPPFYPFYAATDEQAVAVIKQLDWRVLGLEPTEEVTYVLVA